MEYDKDLADFAITHASKLGCSYAEARLEHSSQNGFMIKNGVPQISSFGKVSGLGIRFLINKSLGFMSTNELDKDTIKRLLEHAVSTTKRGSRIGEEITLTEEKAYKQTYEVKQKIKLDDVDPEEKMQLLLDAEKEIMSLNVNVPGRYISMADFTTTEYLVNTDGTKLLATVPKVNFFYFLTIQEKNKTSQRYWQYGNSGGYEFVKKWNIPDMLREEVKAQHEQLKHGIKTPKGKQDLVVAPQVVGIMVHESVGHPYEADRIFGREAAQAGESFVTSDMIGTKIGSDVVTVVDDPTIENSYGFFLYDNEGIKARRKYLMKEGVITEFLHNRETAFHMGLQSNGSSRAVDYDKESIVRMSNTILLPGDYSEEELIEGVKNGIYMKNFMEWNIDDKRLNQKYVGAESYLIKNGKIADRIINPTIEISTPDLWKAVDAVAKNTEYHSGNCGKGEPMQAIPVWFGGPSMRLRNLMIK
jgi:TldD protein